MAHHQKYDQRSNITPKSIPKFENEWISNKINKDGITFLNDLGEFITAKEYTDRRERERYEVTSSQLRNIFSEVKRIELKLADDESNWEELMVNFLLLRPKIAYNTARVLAKSQNSRMKELRGILENALNAVNSGSDFRRFSQFMEGIIAYHKVHGGKD